MQLKVISFCMRFLYMENSMIMQIQFPISICFTILVIITSNYIQMCLPFSFRNILDLYKTIYYLNVVFN